ncbi:uncharacterized protein FIBRA_08291 [Fibroporia radiculosa]|uniref:Glucose-methanol-choline oxidoreductase N-terminal domain-containing protein n=1 Tax=Fibroporia radiculosa TaxID=599839 RepID=J4GWI7_9APHY|nr:uncharacterized protein FIBRA_08291 [Fibroporia radiculosa]CCM06045.1 predicted protein [Fibroporia radiculosa]
MAPRHRFLLWALLAPSAYPAVHCAIYTDPSLLPQTEYDFVIVGAGIGGGVVASRLTEVSDFSVLVIEAGISNENNVDVEIPFYCPTLSPDTSLTWNYTTTPQNGLNNRAIPYPRGRILGGSSTINYMVWNRGSEDDWDRYANYTGDNGWSWNEIYPYMLKSENLVPPSDHHDTTGEVNPSIHGTSGPIQVSLPGYPSWIDGRVINTTVEMPTTFPYNEDMNSGNPLGVGWIQNSISTFGRRSSSATAYLELAYNRSNLDVLIQTQVTQVISSSTVNGLPAFTTVEMAQSVDSETYTVTATKEVILSAGSIGTPQILLLSGIGDTASLESVGVTPLVNLSDVGQNLIDHPLLANAWLVNSTNTFEKVERNATLEAEIYEAWYTNGTGLFVDNGSNQIGWLRLPDNASIYESYSDPSAGPMSPQLEMLFANGYGTPDNPAPYPDTGYYLTILTNVVSPSSRGTLTLSSDSPFDYPEINPNLLGTPFDVAVMVQAIKDAMQYLTSPAWDGYIIQPYGGLSGATTDAELEEYAREYTRTVFHPVGTAHMEPASQDGGVVTSELLVKNTSGLRVVDASVFPYIPSMHPQACVYALAERASDLIKSAWGVST